MSKPVKTHVRRDLARKMVSMINSLAGHVEEMGCTCVEREHGHQRNCMGIAYAKEARVFLSRLPAPLKEAK